MGNKLIQYVNDLHEFIDSGEEIEDVETFKSELMREIQFWQHERFVHLIVTFLFALLTMSLIIVMMFYASIQVFVLFVMFLVLLIPYIKHYYVLENGVQTLYVMYEEITRRYPQKGVPPVCMPVQHGIKIKPFKNKINSEK